MRRLSGVYKLPILLALLSAAPLTLWGLGQRSLSSNPTAEHRRAACEQLAHRCGLQLGASNEAAIGQLLEQFIQHTDGPGSVRLVRADGQVLSDSGDQQPGRGALGSSTATSRIRIPITVRGSRWGDLEASYTDNSASLGSLGQAVVWTLGINLVTFWLVINRWPAWQGSDNVVPPRVRNTLDTIAGGVVILDEDHKIVMANESFQSSCGDTIETLVGSRLSELNFRCDGEQLPWEEAVDRKQKQAGKTVFLACSNEKEQCFVVNATPIANSRDSLGGTLVSFADVTTLEQQKQSLMVALSELKTSQEQIRRQNMQLQELLSKDALTHTFTRRSLFEQLETLWRQRIEQGSTLSCIMLDVDHFKELNDKHGHAAGDQVLREVAQTIQDCVEPPGLVGRYGGEEFCIVLPQWSADEAAELGERIRRAIEAKLVEPCATTASLGMSSSQFGAPTYQVLLEQADQALYVAKHDGRNALRRWSPGQATQPDRASASAAESLSSADQPISYHAAVSLHAALAYRDADTALHSQRVAEISVALGRGLMPVSQLYVLEIAAILHDIGKIGVPDSVLLKPSSLTADEWRVMASYSKIGLEIVEASFSSQALSDVVRECHYWFGGSNVPEGGPVGRDISIGARIVGLADAFDAMVSERSYRKGRSIEAAFEELRRCAGTQFDPELVERFIQLQLGWRPDSRYTQSDMEGKLALAIGHFTERTMHAFETRDRRALRDSLSKLASAGKQYQLPAINHMAKALGKSVAEASGDDWEFAVPILQDLLDMCLTVQRAHVRGVAAKPQTVAHCPAPGFF